MSSPHLSLSLFPCVVVRRRCDTWMHGNAAKGFGGILLAVEGFQWLIYARVGLGSLAKACRRIRLQWSLCVKPLYRKAPLLDGQPALCGQNLYALTTICITEVTSHEATPRYVAKNAQQNGWPLGTGTTVLYYKMS